MTTPPGTTATVATPGRSVNPRRGRAFRIAAVLLVVLLVVSISIPLALREWQTHAPSWGPSQVPIRHIVVLMLENHPFDNLFGTYCQSVGSNCPQTVNGLPPGTCVPVNLSNPSLGCVKPFPFTAANLTTPDLPHDYNSSIASVNGGAMDGFYRAEHGGREPFGYYNGSTVPIAWDLAQQFGIGDNFFSSALSYSLPNHWYLMAGQAPNASIENGFKKPEAIRHTYLNQANATRSVQDLLNASPSVTWKYYDWALTNYSSAINTQPGGFSAYNYWNPLAARAESYTSWYASHFVNRSSFFVDTAAGALPNVSWIMPDALFSDHPPSNLTLGETFISNVVDALSASPDWNSTALFVTWDDYGGFYDHAPPPALDPLGLSFREPVLVVSPFTPAGLVVHSLGYFESLLHFMEWRFNLGCLTPRDCNAPLPFGYFQFNSTARAPVFFPPNAVNATYPITAADLAHRPSFDPLHGAPTPSGTWDTGPPDPGLTPTQLD
jgi:phospholipase C